MAVNYLTTREAAARLGTSVRTIQQWVEKGLLEGWKTDGGHRRISQSSVAALLQSRRHEQATQQAVPSLCMLVAEDDASLLKLYRLQVASWPMPIDIYSAPNGYEALVLAGEMNPDLLVCDLRLPGINGFQVVRAVSEMNRFNHTDIVVVTGLPMAEIQAHGGLPDRVEIISKPIDFARLRDIAMRKHAQMLAT
jgi:excisionase family DNA binding protein